MCQWEKIYKNVPMGKNAHKKTFIKCAKTIKNNYKKKIIKYVSGKRFLKVCQWENNFKNVFDFKDLLIGLAKVEI